MSQASIVDELNLGLLACNQTIQEKLQSIRVWAVRNNITHKAVNEILHLLRDWHPHENVPIDSRTLLQTPRSLTFISVGEGQMYYFGIQSRIIDCLEDGIVPFKLHNLNRLKELDNLITLTIGIDGLPISNSSRKQFWPVLCYIDQSKSKMVFPVSIYYGEEKPSNLDEFLQPFVNECLKLEGGLVYKSIKYNVRIRCVIADAPARSYIKCVKGHNAYYGCERCCRKGKHRNSRLLYVFNKTEVLQTDESFFEKNHGSHHDPIKTSPLSKLDIGMITQIPIDYMHLCCLGVMKKLLLLWKEGPLPHKLRPKLCNSISIRLCNFQSCVPNEFNRKPRGLNELRHWKATEFRTFLLYLGPCALIHKLDKQRFDHFMLFHVSMYILISSLAFDDEWTTFTCEILSLFNEQFSNLYSSDCMIYNVHMLKHLHLDARIHGPLDRISAFPFENSMQPLKRFLRKKNLHLSQIVNRIKERSCLGYISLMSSKKPISVSKYDKNNCYLTTDRRVCMLVEINLNDDCIVKFFINLEGVTFYPIDSTKLGIFYATTLGSSSKIKVTDLFKKCFRVPYLDGFVCIRICDF